jgi:tetratricopeptide (TPR) repeat protein
VKRTSTLYLIFASAIILGACSGSRSTLKEAHKLEESGLGNEAFSRYQSLWEEYQVPDALIGMKRIAQQTLNTKLMTAKGRCLTSKHDEALDLYNDAFNYYERNAKLELMLPGNARLEYEQCRTSYLNDLYAQAESLAVQEKFEEAKSVIAQVLRMDANNKRAQYLETLCDIIPNYNAGKKAMELGLFRDAYESFNTITRLDASYKDALALRDEAISKARFTIAFISLEKEKASANKDLNAQVAGTIKSKILGLKSPFIQLLDRDHLHAIAQEQSTSMSAMFDQDKALQAGKLLGAKYIITGQFLSFKENSTVQHTEEKRGFLGATTKAARIKYMENSGIVNIDANYRFDIIDAETGVVHASEVIPFFANREVVWATYNGNTEKVYPGNWKFQILESKADYVDQDGYDNLQEMFGNKDKSTRASLATDMAEKIGNEVAKALKNFKP